MDILNDENIIVTVPDYLASDSIEEENTENENDLSDNETQSIDYSESLATIINNQENTILLLESIEQNQNDNILSLNEIFTGIKFCSNLGLLVVICLCAIAFGKYIKKLLM